MTRAFEGCKWALLALLSTGCQRYITTSYNVVTAEIVGVNPEGADIPFVLGDTILFDIEPPLTLTQAETSLKFDFADRFASRAPSTVPLAAFLWSQIGCDPYDPYGTYQGTWTIVAEQQDEYPDAEAHLAAETGVVTLFPDGEEVTIDLQITSHSPWYIEE